ncbi:hypothetical protein G9464_12470 [Halostella sp. JP-L12]|uniref:hypothetical protein n=1 Tax=Halostella TaxID=1843185 RepID=UPI0013CE748D|nr:MULTISPECIES: hypothetical protein [Halostella]NHN48402.1 hypothetical protein [Halostella sp. JP-L12]
MPSNHGTVTLGMDFFKSLNSNDKGYFGEKIVGFYLRDQLNDSPEKLFPIFADIDPTSIYLPTPQQYNYSFLEHGDEVIELEAREDWDINQYLIDEDGNRESIGVLKEWPDENKPWMPDITLKITNLYGDDDIERTVLCEVKTGPYAEFRDDQRDVMEILNRSPDRLLLRARVIFDTDEGAIKIQFQKLESTDLDNKIHWTAW